MELRGPKVIAVSLVAWLVKEVCVAAMKELRGERTTAVSMTESNTTRGSPPSLSPYISLSLDHCPNFIPEVTKVVKNS